MLDPGWTAHHDVDLAHLHFGFDARTPAELEAWVCSLRRTGTPWVYTVHDLRNPHHERRDLHDRQLDVLVPAADHLVTLTVGAASEIERRWNRRATVLPHPHVVPFATMQRMAHRRATRQTDTFRVGVHVKSLRPSMAPIRVLRVLVDCIADLPGAVLQVNAHREVLEAHGARYDADLASRLRRWAASGRVDLQVHDYLDDEELWDYLSNLDVSVLPYRFGTHSGWLEACRDLGTTVVSPTCGYFADQGPVLTYEHDEDDFGADSLEAAIRRAFAERPRWGVSVEERRAQRHVVAGGHDRIYHSLITS